MQNLIPAAHAIADALVGALAGALAGAHRIKISSTPAPPASPASGPGRCSFSFRNRKCKRWCLLLP